LNDKAGDAERTIATIPMSTPERSFADWALVYDALRRGDVDELQRLLDSAAIEACVDLKKSQQYRVMMFAFSELPESIRLSAAGQYSLARLFVFLGDVELAEATARQLANSPTQDEWTRKATALLEHIEQAS
jgi:hypothetical protein